MSESEFSPDQIVLSEGVSGPGGSGVAGSLREIREIQEEILSRSISVLGGNGITEEILSRSISALGGNGITEEILSRSISALGGNGITTEMLRRLRVEGERFGSQSSRADKPEFSLRQEVMLEVGASILGALIRYIREKRIDNDSDPVSVQYNQVWNAKQNIILSRTEAELDQIEERFSQALRFLSGLGTSQAKGIA